jgi:hypothetical protein
MYGLAFAGLALPLCCTAATMTGSVRDLAGSPLVAAQVTVQRLPGPFAPLETVASGPTSALGTFQLAFAGGCALQCRVTVTAGGRVVAPVAYSRMAGPDDTVNGLDFVAGLPATLEVEVRDAATTLAIGGPAPEIDFLDDFTAAPPVAIGTGRWRFTGLFPGATRVCVRSASDAYVDECHGGQQLPLNGSVDAVTPLTLAEGANTAQAIALDPGATLTGVLRDRHRGDQPIANAQAQLQLFTLPGALLATIPVRTDAGGRYTVAGLAEGAVRLTLSVLEPYYTPMRYPGLDCIQPEDCAGSAGSYVAMNGTGVTDNLGFDLFPGGVLRGRVAAAAGNAPIAGAQVQVYEPAGFLGWLPADRVTTAADGTWEVTHLRPGTPIRLGTRNRDGWIDRGWPASDCSQAECTNGSDIGVAHGIAAAAYDFALAAGRAIEGTIAPGTADPAGVAATLRVYALQAGQPVLAWLESVPAGTTYRTRGFPEGTHFAVATVDDLAPQCQVYLAQVCQASNPVPDVATATPIVLPSTISTVPGVDFSFVIDRMSADGFEPAPASALNR